MHKYLLAAFVVFAPLVAGCAFQNPKNTPLLTFLDQNLQPESRTAQVALAPVTVPLSVVGGALDIVVLHPIQAGGLAGVDTWNLIWAQPDKPFSQHLIEFPLKAVGTPIAFSVIWVGRTLFDVEQLADPGPPREPRARPPDVSADTIFAMSNPRNRRVINLIQNNLVPESTLGRVAAAPLLAPAYVVGGALDALVVHPLYAIDDAVYDTADIIWEPTDRGYYTECALFPFRVLLSPPVWFLHWGSRSVFDTPSRPPSPDRLAKLLMDPDPRMRMLVAEPLARDTYTGADREPATDAMIRACRAYPEDVAFCRALILRLPRPLTDEARTYLRELALRGQGELCAAAIRRLFQDCLYRPRPELDPEIPEEEREKLLRQAWEDHLVRSVNFLAEVYDDLVEASHKEAEMLVTVLASDNIRATGSQALGLYILRSLARREWPAYAEALSFMLQLRMVQTTMVGRIAAIEDEWRVLHTQPDWLNYVVGFLQTPGVELPVLRRSSEMQVRHYMSRIRQAGRGEAIQLYNWMEELALYSTMMDAAQTAERLQDGSEDDLRVFMERPHQLLIEKGQD